MDSVLLADGTNIVVNAIGLLLGVHTMILAAYPVHEAAHTTLFSSLSTNRYIGEWMGFIVGSCYASFERIRHMHIRHHRGRADVPCFDFKGLIHRHPLIRRALFILEWAYIPATEVVMHLQVIWRPFFVQSQRKFLKRSVLMLISRGALLTALAIMVCQSILAVYIFVWPFSSCIELLRPLLSLLLSHAFLMTPIPEPQTYAMLLAGLGLVGFMGRRRTAE